MEAFESSTLDGAKQLNIYCSSEYASRSRHQYECLAAAAHALECGCTEFQRFAFSVACGRSIPAVLIINGKELAAMRSGAPGASWQKIVDANLLWFEASALMRKVGSFATAARLSFRETRKAIKEELRKRGIAAWKHAYQIRDVRNQSSDEVAMVKAEVVLLLKGEIDNGVVVPVIQDVVRRLRRWRVGTMQMGEERRWRRRPRYVWLRLHTADGRIRELRSRGWKDRCLVLDAEWISRGYRSRPIYVKDPTVIRDGIRIRYSPTLIADAIVTPGPA